MYEVLIVSTQHGECSENINDKKYQHFGLPLQYEKGCIKTVNVYCALLSQHNMGTILWRWSVLTICLAHKSFAEQKMVTSQKEMQFTLLQMAQWQFFAL